MEVLFGYAFQSWAAVLQLLRLMLEQMLLFTAVRTLCPFSAVPMQGSCTYVTLCSSLNHASAAMYWCVALL